MDRRNDRHIKRSHPMMAFGMGRDPDEFDMGRYGRGYGGSKSKILNDCGMDDLCIISDPCKKDKFPVLKPYVSFIEVKKPGFMKGVQFMMGD